MLAAGVSWSGVASLWVCCGLCRVAQRTLSALVKAAGSAVLRAMWAAVASNLTAVLETKGVFVALQIFKAALDLKETELETEVLFCAAQNADQPIAHRRLHSVC